MAIVGDRVGAFVGLGVGGRVGAGVGAFVGGEVGERVGLGVGDFVGGDVGDGVGRAVGNGVGFGVVSVPPTGKISLADSSNCPPERTATPSTLMM